MFVFVAFLLVSTFVFRLAPLPKETPAAPAVSAGQTDAGLTAADGTAATPTALGRTASEQFVATTRAAPAYALEACWSWR